MTEQVPVLRNGFVTWKALSIVGGAMMTVGFSATGLIYNQHVSTPHVGAASKDDVKAVEKRLDRMTTFTDDRLGRLEHKIDRLTEEVMKR